MNPETVRARVVIEYTYPDQVVYGKDDDGRGPQPTMVQIPGLRFIPQDHAVVYEADGKQTVCADVQEHKGLMGTRLRIKNTGLCTVTAERTKHAEDDGWEIRRVLRRLIRISKYSDGITRSLSSEPQPL